ncbi:MAG: KH domain-containing protein [Clostridia bacterium]|nr:KH domain-containing protein [Clostridia bacterium]
MLKELLSDLVKPIVTDPDSVVIIEKKSGKEILLQLNVAPADMGKVIGRHGKIAKAIRTVMKAAATTSGQKVRVDILDADELASEDSAITDGEQ